MIIINNNITKIRRGSKQEDYILFEILGSGGFGTCYRGINKRTNSVYCVKKINRTSKKEAALQSFNAETRLELFSFEHTNIVKLLSASIVTNDDFFYTKFEQLVMVFEFVEGRNLKRLLEDETEMIDLQRMCRFGHDIASALDYVHQRGIVHLDIKPANIMVTRTDVCKVADFGCCQYRESDPVRTESLLTGTFAYRAPELHRGLPPTPQCDVYALGICLWQFWSREMPFSGLPQHMAIFNVVRHNLRPEFTCNFDNLQEIPDSRYQDIATQCWSADQNERPSLCTVIEALDFISE